MAVTLNGVVHGKRIDLDAEPPVPDGAAVIVRIERKPLTKDEKRRLLAATAGEEPDSDSALLSPQSACLGGGSKPYHR